MREAIQKWFSGAHGGGMFVSQRDDDKVEKIIAGLKLKFEFKRDVSGVKPRLRRFLGISLVV